MLTDFAHSIVSVYKSNRLKFSFFSLSAVSAITCFISSILHYTNKAHGNPFTWSGWLFSMLFLILAFVPAIKKEDLYNSMNGLKSISFLIFFLLTVVYFVSHLWDWGTAPWNHNGLFDDASWDIYFVKDNILSGKPFQGAYPYLVYIKEVIFHYYIAAFFMLFGYNLLTFNVALLILGYVTFIFTALLVHKLFKNNIATVGAALIINFLPIHFIQVFVGHRYAIAAPLLMASLYFLCAGFKDKSFFKIALSAVLGGLCFSGAIMGKQYLMGLVGGLVLFILFSFKKSLTKTNWNLAKLFVYGIIISSIPLLMFIYFNQTLYFSNESNYSKLFFETFNTQGLDGIKLKYYDRMIACLFGTTYEKWFIPDFPIVPVAYYLFLIPGLIIAFIKRHYHLIPLALITPVGAFVAGFSDYRVLHAAPVWVVVMAFTIHEMTQLRPLKAASSKKTKSNHPAKKVKKPLPQKVRYALCFIAVAVLLVGLYPSVDYLYEKSKNPFSIHYFAQKDVALSRYVRDIVAGVPNPSPKFRHDEFKKLEGVPEPNYETYVCQHLGYAITHSFLFDYDDKKVMSFSEGLPDNLLQEHEIFSINKRVILNHQKTTKDLKLVWEVSEKTNRIIERFKQLNAFGSDETLVSNHEGMQFSLYVLNIKNQNIDTFKEKVASLELQ